MLTTTLAAIKRSLNKLITAIGRLLTTVGIWLIAIVLLFEEWG